MKSIVERLETLESRTEISELRARYCWHTTRGEREAVLALFTEDCLFENHRAPGEEPARVNGRDALRDYLSRIAPGRRIPMVMNEVTKIGSETAKGSCVMHALGADPFCGHYHDEFRRIEGRWLFSVRRFYPYWPVFRPSTDDAGP